MIEFELFNRAGRISVRFPKEPPVRAMLLAHWLDDGMLLDRDLDRFLQVFDQVETGGEEVEVGAFAVWTYISKARVLLEQAYFPSPEEEANPATTELSFDEAKALILKWRDAQTAWEKNRSQSS